MNNQNKILNKLLDGNKRFIKEESTYPNCSADCRKNLANSQTPHAIVLTCSDSRTPPELIFDQGFGDIFVIRTAGLCIDDITIGSMEYAVEHLQTSLILVLGHENCGAVAAAMQNPNSSSPNLDSIINFIRPSVTKARMQGNEDIDTITKINTLHIVEKLKSSGPILSKAIVKENLDIIGCHYLMRSGEVEVLGD